MFYYYVHIFRYDSMKIDRPSERETVSKQERERERAVVTSAAAPAVAPTTMSYNKLNM